MPATPNTTAPAAASRRRASRFTLAALTEALTQMRQTPELDELNGWLKRVQVEPEELRPHVSFKSGTYARHLVFRSELAELLILCWRPGQRTPIHDHNGSYGAVRVLEGILWETMFALEDERGLVYQRGREWRPGQVTGADVPDIHQLGNPEVSGQDLITLHLYAPPLRSLNIYRVGDRTSTSTLNMNSWNPTI